jgi:hypothetical protein
MQRVVQALTMLTLLALTPALAQGSRPSFKPTSSTLVLPVGQELSDEELAEVEGRWLWAAIGAAMGAHSAVSDCECSGWRAVGAAVSGAALGVVGGAKGELVQVAFNAAKGVGSKVAQAAMAGVGVGTAWSTEVGVQAVGRAWNSNR